MRIETERLVLRDYEDTANGAPWCIADNAASACVLKKSASSSKAAFAKTSVSRGVGGTRFSTVYSGRSGRTEHPLPYPSPHPLPVL